MDSEVNQTISLLTETTSTIQAIQNTIDNICAQNKDELIGAHDQCRDESQQQTQENAHLESIDSTEKVLNKKQLQRPQNIKFGNRKKLKKDNRIIHSQNNTQLISKEPNQDIIDSLSQNKCNLKKKTSFKQLSIESSLKGNKDEIINEDELKKKSKAQIKAQEKFEQKQITYFFKSNKEQIPPQSPEGTSKEENPQADIISTQDSKKRKNGSQQPLSQQVQSQRKKALVEDNSDSFLLNKNENGRKKARVNSEIDNRINSELGNGVFETKSILKFVSWNINGIQQILKGGSLINYIKKGKQDIICLNETRVCIKNFKKSKVFSQIDSAGYQQYWTFNSQNNGQSGVGILSKVKPIRVIEGIGEREFDNKGRVLSLEFDKFIVVNVYVPYCGLNTTIEKGTFFSSEKKDFKQIFNSSVYSFVISLQERNPEKPVIICGDFNVAYLSIDGATIKFTQVTGSTKWEREQFHILMKQGWVDCYRFKDNGWRQKLSCGTRRKFEKRIQTQTRFDYFLMHKNFIHLCTSSDINQEIFGSDHYPIELELNLESEKNENGYQQQKIQQIMKIFEQEIKKEQTEFVFDPYKGQLYLENEKTESI